LHLVACDTGSAADIQNTSRGFIKVLQFLKQAGFHFMLKHGMPVVLLSRTVE
jgi:hypothetical protein